MPVTTPVQENTVWYLKRAKLFECTGDILAGARHLFDLRAYPKRTTLFAVGDDSRLVYFVKSGRIRIFRRMAGQLEVTIAILGPGDVFGEEALFGQLNRTTGARCIEESLLCVSRSDQLFALTRSQPAFAMNLARYKEQQRHEALCVIYEISHLRVPERLVCLFERLAQDFGVMTEHGIQIDVALTQADIAALIGSTRETVSLEVTKLVRNGRLRSIDGRFLLPSAAPDQVSSNSEATTSRNMRAVRV